MKLPQSICLVSTFPLTSALIIGFSTPAVVKPGSNITVRLLSAGYIHPVADIGVAFGWGLPTIYRGYIGLTENSYYLGPGKSNRLRENITVQVHVPAWLPEFTNATMVQLSAGVYSIAGRSGMPGVAIYNVTVGLGEETSEMYVDTFDACWSDGIGGCLGMVNPK